MSDVDLIKEAETEARRVFRFYSRKVFLAPANRHFHEQRINAALLLSEKEPLQGAVADFFMAAGTIFLTMSITYLPVLKTVCTLMLHKAFATASTKNATSSATVCWRRVGVY